MSFWCCEPNLRRRNDECEGGASGMRAACGMPGMAFTAWHDARAAWHVAYSAWHRGIFGMASRHGSRHGSRHRAELLHAAGAAGVGAARGRLPGVDPMDAGLGRAPASGLSARAPVRRRDRRVVWSPRRARAARSLGPSTAPEPTRLRHASPGSRHRGMVRGIARSCSTPRAPRASVDAGAADVHTSPGSRHRGMVRGIARSCSTPRAPRASVPPGVARSALTGCRDRRVVWLPRRARAALVHADLRGSTPTRLCRRQRDVHQHPTPAPPRPASRPPSPPRPTRTTTSPATGASRPPSPPSARSGRSVGAVRSGLVTGVYQCVFRPS